MKKHIFILLLILSSLILINAAPQTDSYHLGDFKLKKVVDGDTISVYGLKDSIRILFIDTEETPKDSKAATKIKAIEKNWDTYLAEKKGESETLGTPVKFNTPLGYEAMQWAKNFFKGVKTVRLELDNPKSTRGYYYRYLAYVLVEKNGQWVNFNLEMIKNGYSPYSTKYGRSLRFHEQLNAAQKEAQEKKLGIWNPTGKHYPDYEKRLVWWNKRGDQIAVYQEKYADNYLFVGGDDAVMDTLKEKGGQKIKLFGLLSDPKKHGDLLTFIMPIKKSKDIIVAVKPSANLGFEILKNHSDYYIYLESTLLRDRQGEYRVEVTQPDELRFADAM